MADTMISAAPAGQPATPAAEPVSQQTAPQQAQQAGNFVTSEQLNASMEEIKRMIQSSSDKSYNRVQKMISSMQQAGIQNPTYEQAKAMLAMQDRSEPQDPQQPDAQGAKDSDSNPEATAWIRRMGGEPSQGFWMDIYDAAQEAGVDMITRDDPEYEQFFLTEGKLRQFEKPRQFVRAFEQAFEAKKNRLKNLQGSGNETGNLASSPALSASGSKSTFVDPKKTNSSDLITRGLRETRR